MLVAVPVSDLDAVAVDHNVESNVVVIYTRSFGIDTSEPAVAADVVTVSFRGYTSAFAAITSIEIYRTGAKR